MSILFPTLLGVLSLTAEVPQVDVYRSGADGYHTYRIPAIEVAADGALLALAEARKYNTADPGHGHQDIDLVLKRSTDGGQTWSAMQVLEDPGELWSAANPATVVDRSTGRVWLFYLRSKPGCSTRTSRPGTDDMQSLARTSDDHGVTWSEPIDLTAVARDMADKTNWRASVIGPGGAIQTKSGRLVVPVWKFTPYGVFTISSDDHGRHWQRGQFVPGESLGSENQLVELSDGRLLIDIRQSSGPRRWRATSRDGGGTWSEPCGGEPVTAVACAIERLPAGADGGRDRLVWTGPRGPGRSDLVVRFSDDDGQSFGRERLLAAGPAAYSDLAVLADGSVGVLWERGVQRGYEFITFTRLTRDWLESVGTGKPLPSPGP